MSDFPVCAVAGNVETCESPPLLEVAKSGAEKQVFFVAFFFGRIVQSEGVFLFCFHIACHCTVLLFTARSSWQVDYHISLGTFSTPRGISLFCLALQMCCKV